MNKLKKQQHGKLELLWKLFDDIKSDIRTKEFERNIVKLQSGIKYQNNFYEQLVHEIETIMHDIVLFEDILLKEVEEKTFPEQYQLVFRFKLESLTKQLFLIYQWMPQRFKTPELRNYHDRAQASFKKVSKIIK